VPARCERARACVRQTLPRGCSRRAVFRRCAGRARAARAALSRVRAARRRAALEPIPHCRRLAPASRRARGRTCAARRARRSSPGRAPRACRSRRRAGSCARCRDPRRSRAACRCGACCGGVGSGKTMVGIYACLAIAAHGRSPRSRADRAARRAALRRHGAALRARGLRSVSGLSRREQTQAALAKIAGRERTSCSGRTRSSARRCASRGSRW
jgi:hypothetical protein